MQTSNRSRKNNEPIIEKLEPLEYLRRYLRVAPLSLAIFRSIEAKNISTQDLKRPILDIGCGFGEFAGVFFNSQVEMGIDISWKELINAQKIHRYQKLTWADARELPFQTGYFNTVLSVSVLEHIDEVEKVLAEIYRVLKPKGKFIFTVNTNKINQMLFWPDVLERWNLTHWSRKYTGWYNHLFKHITLLNKSKWTELVEKSGFRIMEKREIISPEATKLFDLFILTSWPSQIFKWIFGRRWAWRPLWFRNYLVKKYGWIVVREEVEGSNLFIVAQKPGKG